MSRLALEVAEQPEVLRTVLAAQPDALAATRAAVQQATRLFLVGIGSSRHVASYGGACLDALSPVTGQLLAAPGADVTTPGFRSGDVLIAVSQSGRTPALLDLAIEATTAGAKLVSVTNVEGSPLQALAAIALQTFAGAEQVIPATKSVTASMLLLRALAAPVDPTDVSRLCAALTTLTPLSLAAPLPSVVVAGGFAAEAVSDEVALKLAEVTAHLAVAETLVDFLHGPAAVSAPVLALLDPSDANSALLHDRPDVLRVGPDPRYDVVVTSCGDRTLDAISQVVAGQHLALGWAAQQGLDPDDPRGLAKVTLTL